MYVCIEYGSIVDRSSQFWAPSNRENIVESGWWEQLSCRWIVYESCRRAWTKSLVWIETILMSCSLSHSLSRFLLGRQEWRGGWGEKANFCLCLRIFTTLHRYPGPRTRVRRVWRAWIILASPGPELKLSELRGRIRGSRWPLHLPVIMIKL